MRVCVNNAVLNFTNVLIWEYQICVWVSASFAQVIEYFFGIRINIFRDITEFQTV